jgi:hypothetical protein
MGLSERQWEEAESNGFVSLYKQVCSDCFGDDKYLINVVDRRGSRGLCNYCGKKNKRVVDYDVIAKTITSMIRHDYSRAIDELPYDTESEDGFLEGCAMNSFELFESLDLGIDSDLEEDIRSNFDDDLWCESDWAGLDPDEYLIHSWRTFCDEIKYRTRFFFLNVIEPGYQGLPITHIWDVVKETITESGLFSKLPAGTSIHRARLAENGEDFSRAAELGPPPREKAVASRMSPAGIAHFYGAFDAVTAAAETLPRNSHAARMCFGEWQTTKTLTVIDFTTLPDFPSRYDFDRRRERDRLSFLNSFIRAIANPIEKDGREHIDYVPNQIVSEYLRTVVRSDDGLSVDGIIFPSSRNLGKCLTLFFDKESCADSGKETEETVIVLKKSSVKLVGQESDLVIPKMTRGMPR